MEYAVKYILIGKNNQPFIFLFAPKLSRGCGVKCYAMPNTTAQNRTVTVEILRHQETVFEEREGGGGRRGGGG